MHTRKLKKEVILLLTKFKMHLFSDKLYAIGGYDGHERLNTVEMFEPENHDWKLVAPMLGKRRSVD